MILKTECDPFWPNFQKNVPVDVSNLTFLLTKLSKHWNLNDFECKLCTIRLLLFILQMANWNLYPEINFKGKTWALNHGNINVWNVATRKNNNVQLYFVGSLKKKLKQIGIDYKILYPNISSHLNKSIGQRNLKDDKHKYISSFNFKVHYFHVFFPNLPLLSLFFFIFLSCRGSFWFNPSSFLFLSLRGKKTKIKSSSWSQIKSSLTRAPNISAYLFMLTIAVCPAFFNTWSHSSSSPRIMYLHKMSEWKRRVNTAIWVGKSH